MAVRAKAAGGDASVRNGTQYNRLTAQIAAKTARRASQLALRSDLSLPLARGGGDGSGSGGGGGEASGPWGILKKQQATMTAWARVRAAIQRLDEALLVRPGSARLQNWFYLCVVMALVSGWVLPFHFAFLEAGALLKPYNDWVAFMEYIGTALFLADFLARFFIAYVDPETGLLVTSKRKIARRYLLSWQCLLDVLGWFPFDWIVLDTSAASGASEQTLVSLAWIKLLHLARLYRVFELFADLDYRMVLSQGSLLLTRNYTYVFFCTHWAACVLYHIAHHEAFSPESWVGRNADRFRGRPVGERYLLSLYFSVSAFTGLGDSTLFAGTVPEAGFMILYLMFNLFLGAYIMGTVTMLVVKGDERSKEFRELMSNLNEFSKNHELPPRLTSAMQEHLEVTFNTEQVDDEHVLGIYPTTIRRKVLRHLYLQPVRSCYLFRGCKQRFLDALLTAARVELFMPGVQIMTEGDNVTELNIIVSGAVLLAEAGINLTAAFSEFASAAEPGRGSRSGRGGDASTGGMRRVSDVSVLGRSSSLSRLRNVSMNGSMRDISVHSAAGFMALAASRKILARYSSDPLAEVPFFTDVPSNETIMSQSVVRVLSLPKSAWESLMTQFPQQARLVLTNLQNHAELALSAELHEASDASGLTEEQLKAALAMMKDRLKGGKGDRADRAAAPGDRRGGVQGGGGRGSAGKDGAGKDGAGKGGVRRNDPTLLARMLEALPQTQLDFLSRLHDVRSVVRAHVRKVDQVRTFEFLGCASDGNVETLRNMLNQGVSPNSADYDGRTGLMLAAAAGHEAVVRLLLDSGAKSDQLDAFGNSAMCEAVKNSHDSVIDLLLSYGATLGMEPMAVASTMCTSVFEGDLVKLRRLLRSGAPPDACDYDRRSALHIAGAEGHLAAVKLLVEEGGADPEFQDRWGNTALDEARRVGAAPVVAYLEGLLGAEKLAESGSRCVRHVTSEFLTACGTGDAERARFMAQHLQPGCVFTGLALAASWGHKGLVEMLIVWVPSELLLLNGSIALAEAARMGRAGAVAALRAAGVKLADPRDASLVSALQGAVLAADVRVVAALLAAGVDATAAKYGGGGLLHAAALSGSLEAVRRLVEDAGVPPGAEDSVGKTPALVAEAAKFPRVAEYLRWALSLTSTTNTPATSTTATNTLPTATMAVPISASATSLAAAAAARFGPLPDYSGDEGAAARSGGGGGGRISSASDGSDELAPAMPFGGGDPDLPQLLAHMPSFPVQGRRGPGPGGDPGGRGSGVSPSLSRESSWQQRFGGPTGQGQARKQASVTSVEALRDVDDPSVHPHPAHAPHTRLQHQTSGLHKLPPPPPQPPHIGFRTGAAATSSLTGFLITHKTVVSGSGSTAAAAAASGNGVHKEPPTPTGAPAHFPRSSVTTPSSSSSSPRLDMPAAAHAPPPPSVSAPAGSRPATTSGTGMSGGRTAAAATAAALSTPHALQRPYGSSLPVLLEEEGSVRSGADVAAAVGADGDRRVTFTAVTRSGTPPPPLVPPPAYSPSRSGGSARSAAAAAAGGGGGGDGSQTSLPKPPSLPQLAALQEQPPRRQSSGPAYLNNAPPSRPLSSALSPSPSPQSFSGTTVLTRLRSSSITCPHDGSMSTTFVLEVAPPPPPPQPPVLVSVTAVAAAAAAASAAAAAASGSNCGGLSANGAPAAADSGAAAPSAATGQQSDTLEMYLSQPLLGSGVAPPLPALLPSTPPPASAKVLPSVAGNSSITLNHDALSGALEDSISAVDSLLQSATLSALSPYEP